MDTKNTTAVSKEQVAAVLADIAPMTPEAPAPVTAAAAVAPTLPAEIVVEVGGTGKSGRTVFGFFGGKKYWLRELQGQKVPIGARFKLRNPTLTEEISSEGVFKILSGDISFSGLNNGAHAAAAASGAWKQAQGIHDAMDTSAL